MAAELGEFRVLGPLEVEVAGQVLDLGGRQLRLVLSLLVAGAGRVVSLPTLVDGLWERDAPADAVRTVQKYVSRLRTVLRRAADPDGPGLVVTRPPGYVLRADPDAVDAVRFERLAASGRRALSDGRPDAAAASLRAALQLWRGAAYAEFDGTGALRAEAGRLTKVRLVAVQDRIEADLAAGQGAELIAELEQLVGREPGNERLWGQLMRALYRAGRQVDAAAAFRQARAALIDAAGLEPSPALSAIHQQVLEQAPGLLPVGTTRTTPAAGRPAQLPAAVSGFAGRAGELSELDAILAAADAGPGRPTTVVVSAVSGTAGVGKTALALHWAHRVADRFPDGQLYVNLRGHGPGGPELDPADAVRGFLDALGVPAERVPSGLDAQAARYRSELADRRMLVVLDNAGTVDQVRPLLPGTAGCLVLVTSRSTLTGLVAEHGARPIRLDVLTPAEAAQLLAARVGSARAAAEPDAVAEIIARCARLPLALALVAARAAIRPHLPLETLAAELRDAGGRLDPFASDDPKTDVRAVFSWSYATLTAGAARLFRLLGPQSGRDVSAAAAASLAGGTRPDVDRWLAELARTGLIVEQVPGRYACHDLLAAYAGELTHDVDPPDERRAGLIRLLDYYTHTAYTAALLVNPARDPIPLPLAPPGRGAVPDQPADQPAASAWLAAEYPVLQAAVRQAAGAGLQTHAWQLAWALNTFMHRTGHWQDAAGVWRAAAAAAERLTGPAAAYAHRQLGYTETRLGRYREAHHHLHRALHLFTQVGDLVGQADAHHDLCYLAGRQRQPEEALHRAEQALALYRAAGDRNSQAHALNSVGCYRIKLGDHAGALSCCGQALALFQQAGDRYGQAATWDSLGCAHRHLGRHARAVDCYRRALTGYRDLGDRYNEADVLHHLGKALRASGDRTAAHDAWTQALTILTDLDHPDADPVRAALADLGPDAGAFTPR